MDNNTLSILIYVGALIFVFCLTCIGINYRVDDDPNDGSHEHFLTFTSPECTLEPEEHV